MQGHGVPCPYKMASVFGYSSSYQVLCNHYLVRRKFGRWHVLAIEGCQLTVGGHQTFGDHTQHEFVKGKPQFLIL